MLGLARHLPREVESTFVTFTEHGRAQALLDEVHGHGFAGIALKHNFPRLWRASRETASILRDVGADLVTASGYKPDVVGWHAARSVRIPFVIVSHGWTAATWKVRIYERLDRWVHRRADRVVCVSAAQADKVRQAGVGESRIVVIRNAVGDESFAPADPRYGERLRAYFKTMPRHIIGAVGRLSPEKGFDDFVRAAQSLIAQRHDVGFVLFGEGPMRGALEEQIERLGLRGRVVLAGFRGDVAKFLPHLDVLAISSHTEGLPTILLEAMASGVPVAATNVGGIAEALEDGRTGLLTPAKAPSRLSDALACILADDDKRRAMGEAGRQRALTHFTFARQSAEYLRLFQQLTRAADVSTSLPSVADLPMGLEQR